MASEAFKIDNGIVYWDSIILAFGICACALFTAALYRKNGGRCGAVAILLPIALIFGIVLSRLLYWYCHQGQFSGPGAALSSFSAGSYCLPGAFLGVALAVLLLRLLGVIPDHRLLFDCLAPGAALGLAILRLSMLFNTGCRSKIVITNPDLQHLPIASGIQTSTGLTEYRFATFFVEAIAFFLIFLILLALFSRRRTVKCGKSGGNIGLIFLLLYSSVELVCDSTRYDAVFFTFNAFISVVQIFCAVLIVACLVLYSVRSVRCCRLRPWHIALWVIFLAAIGCCGYLEYLVQRHGNWFLPCYCLMAAASLLMVGDTLILYKTGCET